ncbi:MAG: ATP-binding cassette domain-containing protein [Bacteroidales bacterium]|nr:ATP-binding cassette domain-containing protein [Bacteroidales bacterium]
MMDIIELSGITKSFGSVVAVNNLSLKVPRGSIYGFIGPNGSGKTTTIRMIMKIMYPDHGKLLVNGQETNFERLKNVGYLPEDRGLYKKMKIGELLQFHGELNNGADLPGRINQWLKRLELLPYKEKKVETLSKGMRQKLQFIATILHQSELIILDEPFSGLDPVNADMMKDIILELQENGATIIFSTHDMAMAERMCDYIFMIYQGKKVLDGTLEHIQDQYGNDTLRIQSEMGAEALKGLNGIENVNNFGKLQEIRLEEGVDPQKILAELLKKTRISKFEITKPSLNDIFIRIASPERKEIGHE